MENKKQNEEQSSNLEIELLKLKQGVQEALELTAQGDENKAAQVIKSAVDEFRGTGAAHPGHQDTQPAKVPEGSRIIEGVFDGQHMIGADGKQYLVPPNYASKSKLVEGDLMKLSITPEGAFIYKQIGPIARKRIVCALRSDGEGMWCATDGAHSWRLLTAAVSYFRGKDGDEAVILVPQDTPSRWAAVENIIAK